jgi:ATP-dependent exoDNAse (exonuclease V) beta subunit
VIDGDTKPGAVPGSSPGADDALADDALADDAARRRIATDLGTTLFVAAGAGSGKTTQLVERVVALVLAGTPMEAIAAITFTDKAADELRQRVRAALQQRAGGTGGTVATATLADRGDALPDGGDEAERCRRGVEQLDQAALCTLHAFAQRILTAYPVEAGLPPAVAVLDEIASDIDFEERFQAFYAELISRPDLERTLTLALELGITPEQLRAVAERFDDNWDLVRVAERPIPEPPPLDLTPVLVAGRELLAACRLVGPGDNLAAYVQGWLPPWLEQLEAAIDRGTDDIDLMDLVLHGAAPNPRSWGGNAWDRTSFGSAKRARDALKGLCDPKIEGSALAPVVDALVEPILARLGDELAHFTLRQAEARRRAGRLSFHDLLVLCRAVVRDRAHGPRIRRELAQRYQALLLDEYQDTDPLQLDIVRAIAVPPETGDDGPPRPGHLFFVGDPKQSLYRFRRADIDLFLRTPGLVLAEPVSLTSNFRSTPPIIDWINHVFAQLITPATADDGSQAQPPFEALSPLPASRLAGPAVTVLGAQAHPHKTPVGAQREAEAVDVAALIDRIVAEGWEVRPAGGGPPVPARRRDIAILIPARTVLGQLEAALRAAGIPYRLDTGSLVYAADEVRTLLLALRVIDDPTDDLAVVSVLRSPLYGCSDVDLYRWRRQRGGTWSALAPRPDRLDGDDPVWDALADLRERIEARPWRTPSEQLDSLVRDRRVLETALAGPSPLDAWHRVRFVVEQARAWSDAGGRFLRDYLDWTKRQTGLTGRVAEAVLDDEDGTASSEGDRDGRRLADAEDAVRVLTVHGAKGLEFPITIVCGFNSPGGNRQRGVQVAFGADGQTLRLRSGLEQQGFDATKAIDEQMDQHERIRLLYVACTRARDHLAVSVHRVEPSAKTERRRYTGAQLLAPCVVPSDQQELPSGRQLLLPAVTGGPAHPDTVAEAAPPPPAVRDLAAWRAARHELIATARLPRSVSATRLAAEALGPELADTSAMATGLLVDEDDDRFEELAGAPAPDDAEPGLAKRPVDLDLPAWRRGRYGTAIGRAVHGVLQVVDLASGEGLDALARAQAAAEGIDDEWERIARLARSALGAPCVAEAAGGEHWREVYVGVPFGDTVLEGYIDLLYRRPDGLVVVDHKTDRIDTTDGPGPLPAAKLAAYRRQLAAYAVAVERATAEPVVAALLVLCSPPGGQQVAIADLRAAMDEVTALLEPPPERSASGPAPELPDRLFDPDTYVVPDPPV